MGRKAQYYDYDETITEFLNSQKETTRNIYRCNFRYIIDFTGLSGKEILESKKADDAKGTAKEYLWEKKAVELKKWAKETRGLSDTLGRNIVAILRSFFVYYRTPLVFTRAETNKVSAKAQRVKQDYALTNEDIAKLVFVADLREKYIVLGGKSFGLRAIDFVKLTYGEFRSISLNQETPISLGEIYTVKEGVMAYPFIDSDFQPIIKALLEATANHANDEQILTFNETELTTTLQNLAKKANIQLGGKHLRFHCFRKYLCDRLSSVMSDQKWKKIVGKTTSEDAYITTLNLKEDYAKAMKLTTVMNGNGNGKVTKLSEEVKMINERLDKLVKENFVLMNNHMALVNSLEEKGINVKKLIAQYNAKYEHQAELEQEEQEQEEQEKKPDTVTYGKAEMVGE